METIPNVGTIIRTSLPPTEDKFGFNNVANEIYLIYVRTVAENPNMTPGQYLGEIEPYITYVCGSKKAKELLKKLEGYKKEEEEDLTKIDIFNDPDTTSNLAAKRALSRILTEAHEYHLKKRHGDGYPVGIGVLGEEGVNVENKPIRLVSEKILKRIADARKMKVKEVEIDDDGVIDETSEDLDEPEG